MKMLKKSLALLLALAMVLSLAACGGGETEQDPAGEGEWPEVTIQYININGEAMGGAQVQEIVNKFNETNEYNINVEFNFISSNYPEIATEVQSYLAAGQNVGVVQVGYAYINYFAESFPQMQDLNEVIATYFPEDADFLAETYDPAVLGLGYAVNGKLAGAAYGMSTPILFINADMCTAAGLDVTNPPKTWEEVRVWGNTIKEKTGNYGVAIQNPADTYSIIPMFLSAGQGPVLTEADGKYTAELCNEDSIAAWTLLQDMTKEGSHIQLNLEEAVAAFAGGSLGMFLTTSGRAAYFANNCDFAVQTTLQPTFEGNELQVCIGGNVLSIISDDEAQIKASWIFIKYLLETQNIGTWCEVTGYLPPTQTADSDPKVQEILGNNPLLAAAVEEKPYAAQWTSWPGPKGLQVDQNLVNMRDAILSNMDDVATVLQNTEDTINGMLN